MDASNNPNATSVSDDRFDGIAIINNGHPVINDARAVLGPEAPKLTAASLSPPCYNEHTHHAAGFLIGEGAIDQKVGFAAMGGGINSLGGVWDNTAKGA